VLDADAADRTGGVECRGVLKSFREPPPSYDDGRRDTSQALATSIIARGSTIRARAPPACASRHLARANRAPCSARPLEGYARPTRAPPREDANPRGRAGSRSCPATRRRRLSAGSLSAPPPSTRSWSPRVAALLGAGTVLLPTRMDERSAARGHRSAGGTRAGLTFESPVAASSTTRPPSRARLPCRVGFLTETVGGGGRRQGMLTRRGVRCGGRGGRGGSQRMREGGQLPSSAMVM